MQNLTLVILAAGIGKRFGGLKQVEPIGPNGEYLLHYSVFDALRAGFSRIVFILRPELLEPFRSGIGRQIEAVCQPQYVFQKMGDLPAPAPLPERAKPWGTAHAVWSCRQVVSTPFAVLNADDYYGPGSLQILADFLRRQEPSSSHFGLIGFPLENTLSSHGTVARAVCQVTAEGFLSGIVERTQIQRHDGGCAFTLDGQNWTPLDPGTTVSMNLWGFTPQIFPALEAGIARFLQRPNPVDWLSAEMYLPNMVGDLLEQNLATVKILPTTDPWFGITYPDDKEKVKQAILTLHQQGIYPEQLWEEARWKNVSEK